MGLLWCFKSVGCGNFAMTAALLPGASMHSLAQPILADYIWIGGGTLGLILVVVIIVLLLRK